MVELCADGGYPGVTVRRLLRTSGISSRTFYTHFANVEECFASTYRAIVRRVLRELSEAAVRSPDWTQGLRTGLRALLEQIAADPGPAHLVLVDSFDAGPALLNEMALASRQFERFLPFDLNRAQARSPLLHTLEEAAIAGLQRVVRWRLMEGRADELPALADQLTGWIAELGQLDLAQLSRAGRALAARRAKEAQPEETDAIGAELFRPVGGERGRVSSAVARLALAHGYWKLDPLTVRQEAGVSRRRFAHLYENLDECFLAVVEALLREVAQRALNEAAGARTQPELISRATTAFCVQLANQPQLAQLIFVDVLCPGGAGLWTRERLLTSLAGDLREGSGSTEPSNPTVKAEAAVAGAWQIAQAEVAADRASRLPTSAILMTALLERAL